MKRSPLLRKKALKAKKACPTVEGLLKSGLVSKASGFKAKRKPIRKRSPRQKGWWDVALEIWNSREHVCEVTGTPLGDVPLPIFFSHLLPRSTYPDFKRDMRNIRLKSPGAHHEWHKHGPEILQDYPRWRKTCELYFALRNEANGL